MPKRLVEISAKPLRRVVGVMSGTSGDAIDVAVCDVPAEGRTFELLAGDARPFDPQTRELLDRLAAGRADAETLNRLNRRLGVAYAQAVEAVCADSGVPVASLDAAAVHGLTVHHLPGEATLQIGEAAEMAERLGCVIISNFRARDIAAGGQGAPLVPLADWLLFAHEEIRRVCLNLGGIANITVLPPGCRPEDVVAFDTGPGNMVIDGLASALSSGAVRMDREGVLAAEGDVDEELLAQLLDDEFFRSPPPKSTGRERYGRAYVGRVLAEAARRSIPDADLLRTACALTAATVASAIHEFVPGHDFEVIVSGGGVHNRTLIRELGMRIVPARLRRSDRYGVDADLKEAIAFCLLGNRTLSGQPSNLPSVTGAAGERILGQIVLP